MIELLICSLLSTHIDLTFILWSSRLLFSVRKYSGYLLNLLMLSCLLPSFEPLNLHSLAKCPVLWQLKIRFSTYPNCHMHFSIQSGRACLLVELLNLYGRSSMYQFPHHSAICWLEKIGLLLQHGPGVAVVVALERIVVLRIKLPEVAWLMLAGRGFGCDRKANHYQTVWEEDVTFRVLFKDTRLLYKSFFDSVSIFLLRFSIRPG
ncbi:hypothetical protein Tco_0852372 [Tanacetum coccineum]